MIAGDAVVFTASYNGGSDYGLFKHSGGTTTTLVKNGDPAPIGEIDGAGDIFADFDGTNVAAWLGFVGQFSAHYNGVFIHDGTDLMPIAQSDEPAPIGVFDGFDVPAINGNSVALRGIYREINSGAFYEGIFTTNPAGGPLTTVAKAGDPSPLGPLNLDNGFMKVIGVADGQVAFLAEGENAKGILTASTSGGPLNAVVKTGDMLFGSEVIDVLPGLSNDRFLPFHYYLADGRHGIALAVSVPEPHVAWLIGAPIVLASAAQAPQDSAPGSN